MSTTFYKPDPQSTGNVVWEVPQRYEQFQLIGCGAYGSVCRAYDSLRGTHVAIKKLARPFLTDTLAKRTYREIRLLQHMQHENVISLLDVFTPHTSPHDLKDVYLVCQLMDSDLHRVVKSQRLDGEQIKFMIYQILRGLKYIHSAGVIHRDLKPANIAVTGNCGVRILDFGLARQTQDEMTGYVATRWYRAPEIMLNWMHYTQAVDIWSVGCIFAELLNGQPIFPGDDRNQISSMYRAIHDHDFFTDITQMNWILHLLGTPSAALFHKIEGAAARDYIASLDYMPPRNFQEVFPSSSPEGLDLLKKMLEMDPEMRITAAQALEHPYLRGYHITADEPVCMRPFNHGFETFDYPVETWKALVYDEILRIHQTEV